MCAYLIKCADYIGDADESRQCLEAALALYSHKGQHADALRVAHSGTGRVFPNWPTARTPLSVLCGGAAVSPGGAYLALRGAAR